VSRLRFLFDVGVGKLAEQAIVDEREAQKPYDEFPDGGLGSIERRGGEQA